MRIHNSRHPISTLRPRPQAPYQRKPCGLWWAEADAWSDLIRAGQLRSVKGLQVGPHDYEVLPEKDFRLLTLSSFDDVMDISRRFAQPMPHAERGFFWQSGDRQRYDPDQDEDLQRHGRSRAFLMDWTAVSREWDGIEIAMPVGGMRGNRPFVEWLDTDWDIPSGCAWRTEDLEVRLLPANDLPQPW